MPHPQYPHVFEPITVGATTLRNRIFVPAHTTNYGERNLPSDRHRAYHAARARGGAGLIIFEGIRVHRSSLGRPQGVNGYEPEAIPAFARIAEAVQAAGARLFGQILHLGRHVDGNYSRTPAWSASPVPWSATAPVPHAMTEDEIARVVEAHAQVGSNLFEAGLDGVELTLGHGHLLQQFLSPASNFRDDAYGGSFENRLRFPLETLRAVRAAVGPDRTLGIRISAAEYLDGGLTITDMCQVVQRLADEVPVDFINVSHSAYHGSYTVSTQMADMAFLLSDFQPLTRRIRDAVGALPRRPTILTACRYQTVAQAEAMLAEGAADMVGMARAHIADPEMVAKAHDGREEETTPCIGCNQGCANMLALSLPITCLTNPRAGREAAWPAPALNRTRTAQRITVVGGGPGGMEAAAVAAERGHEVTLFERADRLGGALRWTGRMPLRGEFTTLLERQIARLTRAGVDLRTGVEATPDSVLKAGADRVILAIGATPRAAKLEGAGTALTLEQALADTAALGTNVVLMDRLGTWSVVSVAEHLADLGKTCTLVAPTGTPGWTISMYSSFALHKRLRDKNIRIIGRHTVVSLRSGVAVLRDLSVDDRTLEVAADSVIAPVQPIPRTIVSAGPAGPNAPEAIVSIGDCQAPRTALEAIFEGHEAGREV